MASKGVQELVPDGHTESSEEGNEEKEREEDKEEAVREEEAEREEDEVAAVNALYKDYGLEDDSDYFSEDELYDKLEHISGY